MSLFNGFKKIALYLSPTPLRRLSKHLGGPRIYIKAVF